LIHAATLSLHHDKNFYKNPEVFEPFRFAHMREDDPKHQFASTSIEYLPFGLGKHAWYDLTSSIFYRGLLADYFVSPGRFFAAAELIFMLAHVVMTYDVKMAGDNATYPPSQHIGTFIAVNPHAKVMFRNRVD
jgi:hypothetical protein